MTVEQLKELTDDFLQEVGGRKQALRTDTEHISENEVDPAQSGVYLFVSFDISNSTAFKVEYPYLWGTVIQAFYGEVLKLTDTYVYRGSGSDTRTIRKLWKMVGDEVLLQMQVYRPEDLYGQVQEIWKFQESLMGNLIEKVEQEQEQNLRCGGCYGHCGDIRHCIQSMLGVKVTVWIAECYPSATQGKPNIIYTRPGIFGINTIDFLGRDIDEGFRIAHEAAKDKLIVSPLLAWMIWRYAKDNDDLSKVVEANFKITAFRKLKGVWNERLVPIVMYHPRFSEFDELLEYDEAQLPVYENLKDRDIPAFLGNPRFSVSRLEKIFRNIHREEENESIYNALCDQPDPTKKELGEIPIEGIHLACALFTQDNKLLVHKHQERGLEFGCVPWSLGKRIKAWAETCKEGYLNKYQLDIELAEDPVAVGTYLYRNKHGKRIQGLILVGKLLDELDETAWPSGWKVYSREEIETLSEENEDMVSDFRENALRGFDILNRTGEL